MTAFLVRLSAWNWIPYFIIAVWLGWTTYDHFVPVVRMQGEVVSKTNDSVVVHMWGRKLRDCRYIGIQGFSRVGDGDNRDMFIRRVDMPAYGTTRPQGLFDIGFWELRPLSDATRVSVWVQHSC